MPAAALASFSVAALSVLYAVVFLTSVRGHPDALGAAALADACIALSGVLVGVAAAGIGARMASPSRAGHGLWVAAFGIGYGLLSAAHGAFAAISELGGVSASGISPTDPRGLATFGLAGVWMLALGVIGQRSVAGWPSWLRAVALAGGADLIVLFAATVAGADLPILIAGGLASVILGPAFWIGAGLMLSGGASVTSAAS